MSLEELKPFPPWLFGGGQESSVGLGLGHASIRNCAGTPAGNFVALDSPSEQLPKIANGVYVTITITGEIALNWTGTSHLEYPTVNGSGQINCVKTDVHTRTEAITSGDSFTLVGYSSTSVGGSAVKTYPQNCRGLACVAPLDLGTYYGDTGYRLALIYPSDSVGSPVTINVAIDDTNSVVTCSGTCTKTTEVHSSNDYSGAMKLPFSSGLRGQLCKVGATIYAALFLQVQLSQTVPTGGVSYPIVPPLVVFYTGDWSDWAVTYPPTWSAETDAGTVFGVPMKTRYSITYEDLSSSTVTGTHPSCSSGTSYSKNDRTGAIDCSITSATIAESD